MPNPMHICFISQEYPPDTGWGGIGSYVYEMAHGLVRAGHHVTVIARAASTAIVVNDAGVDVHRVDPAPGWNRYRGLWRLNRVWPGFAWAAMLRLRQIHMRRPVDLVEAGEGRADSFFLSRMPRRPGVIVRLHTARIFIDRLNLLAPSRRSRLTYWLERRAILTADAVTAPCHAMVALTKTWIALGQRPVGVVPNPVDSLLFAPAMESRREEVLFVGRLERRKGLQDLCEAMPQVLRRRPNASFRLIGSDGQHPSGQSWREMILEPLNAEERTRVCFERVPRNELVRRYSQAAVSIAPSIWENAPYVVLEAMACATPVVATRAGGIPEIIEDGKTGVLVPAQSPDYLADALCSLLADQQRRESIGRLARERIESHYHTDRVVPAMLAIYADIAARRPGAAGIATHEHIRG